MTTTRQFVALICFAFFSLSAQAASTLYSDILLDIVQHCVDTSAANYCQQCRAPTLSSVCSTEKTCQKTTDVWAMNDEFVAIRDIKMCGCPADFVHGLVLPRKVVTGVEDPVDLKVFGLTHGKQVSHGSTRLPWSWSSTLNFFARKTKCTSMCFNSNPKPPKLCRR